MLRIDRNRLIIQNIKNKPPEMIGILSQFPTKKSIKNNFIPATNSIYKYDIDNIVNSIYRSASWYSFDLLVSSVDFLDLSGKLKLYENKNILTEDILNEVISKGVPDEADYFIEIIRLRLRLICELENFLFKKEHFLRKDLPSPIFKTASNYDLMPYNIINEFVNRLIISKLVGEVFIEKIKKSIRLYSNTILEPTKEFITLFFEDNMGYTQQHLYVEDLPEELKSKYTHLLEYIQQIRKELRLL